MNKVIMIGGLPGSGKTFLAKKLTERINYKHINSDAIRNELNKRGKYKTEEKKLIYAELLKEIKKQLDNDTNVIVDTTFYRNELRNKIIKISSEFNSETYFILCTASEEATKDRLYVKREDSEADFAVYKKIKSEFEPPNMNYLELSTDKESIEEMIDKVKQYCNIEGD